MKLILSIAMIAMIGIFTACEDDEKAPEPFADFQYEISEDNNLEVSFTNNSENAETYEWAFGDGETSTEENPVHTYAEAGSYDVVLTATNADGVSVDAKKTIEVGVTNLLTGEGSKTWKLIREGTVMGIGPDAENYTQWWSLENDGSRPCVFKQTWTFNSDGTMDFDDGGMMWGDDVVFADTDLNGVCFEATEENMVNTDGVNVSEWLSGTYDFTYDSDAGTLTLNGKGAWMGLLKVTPDGDVTVPQESVTYGVNITEEDLYDLMEVSVSGDGWYWQFNYVSYHDWANEPDVVEEAEEYGEDLEDLTPDEMWNTFAGPDDYVLLDTAAVYPGTENPAANGGMTFTMGVDDPAGGSTPVGQYDRAGTYQELQFQQDYDIQFDNFTTVSVDLYVPSTNDYSGDLTKGLSIIIGEASQTEQWWTGHIQYDINTDDVELDTWQTWTFNLDSPTSGPGDYTPYERADLDFIAITIGGGGHEAEGTYYIRNFKFE